MIHDVDDSLLALVRRDALTDPKVEVAFEAPTKDWVAKRNAPTVDLYLYDIREDLARREVVWEEVRDDTGRVIERRPPARRFKLSYLVTAWTKRPEDEHLLLSSLLLCFVRHEVMPADLMAGTLAGQAKPVYLNVAQPPTADRSLADIWSALGGELKPSLDLAVIAPIPVERAETAGPPVTETPRIDLHGPDGEIEEASAVGQVGSSRAAGRRRSRGGPRRGGVFARGAPLAGQPLSPSEPAEQEETLAAGTEKEPGRRFRLRGIDRT